MEAYTNAHAYTTCREKGLTLHGGANKASADLPGTSLSPQLEGVLGIKSSTTTITSKKDKCMLIKKGMKIATDYIGSLTCDCAKKDPFIASSALGALSCCSARGPAHTHTQIHTHTEGNGAK